LCATGNDRNRFTRFSFPGVREVADVLLVLSGGHREQVADAHRAEVRARVGGEVLGKKPTTRSSTDRRLGDARPTAVDVKLLLSENSMCGSSAA